MGPEGMQIFLQCSKRKQMIWTLALRVDNQSYKNKC